MSAINSASSPPNFSSFSSDNCRTPKGDTCVPDLTEAQQLKLVDRLSEPQVAGFRDLKDGIDKSIKYDRNIYFTHIDLRTREPVLDQIERRHLAKLNKSASKIKKIPKKAKIVLNSYFKLDRNDSDAKKLLAVSIKALEAYLHSPLCKRDASQIEIDPDAEIDIVN